ncbi:MAG: endonuclease/exonuclease/phosphatase family protein [Chitinophagaceae bacterium]|nr:endonuclease/exonuclease/phosphatase family protein [Chitinophagaceae bacterium]
MLKVVKGVFKSALLIVTVPVGIGYLLTCLIPYIDTGKYWFVSLLGLAFIPLLVMMLILMFMWILVRSKIWIACLAILLLGFQQITSVFSFHLPSQFKIEKQSGNLRVMQWNVHSWNQVLFYDEPNVFKDDQPQMMALIKQYDPDILCVEEFFESTDPEKFKSNIEILQEMGYTYHFFAHGDLTDGSSYSGIAIFSRFPILSTGKILSTSRNEADPLAFADVKKDNRIIRVFALHLQSVRFHESDYSNIQRMKNPRDPKITGSRTITSKLKRGFKKRYEQSVLIEKQIQQTPYPVILCGDFNDVPNSGVYFNIRKNLQDAFLRKGSFVGRSFRFISPTLRIDYIMPSKEFKVQQFTVIRVKYSDHYPLVSDISF